LSSAKTLELTNALAIKLFQGVIMNRRTIMAAALAAGLLVQTQGFSQIPISPSTSASTVTDAATTSDPEKAAHKTWRAVINNTPVPGRGCFHVSYPSVAWESVDCKLAKPRAHPVRANRKVGTPDTAGNTYDYVARAQGLISRASGDFEGTSGLTSVTSVGGTDAIDGSNEYGLQLNTNNDGHTHACGDYTDCHVWQQFVYETDGYSNGEGALLMQYWLLDWTGNCPKGWNTFANGSETDCWKNSAAVALPDIPVTNLGCCVVLYGYADAGGDDRIFLRYGDDEWTVSAEDSVLDIASVWSEAEFNIFGDGGSSQAQVNLFSSVIVTLALIDGSNSAPTCLPPQDNDGTTAETSNLNLGTCQAGVGSVEGEAASPYITFSESFYPVLPCIRFCGEVRPNDSESLR
jgi:hypothetical protein